MGLLRSTIRNLLGDRGGLDGGGEEVETVTSDGGMEELGDGSDVRARRISGGS